MAHENLDVINMTIRKKNCLKLAVGNNPTAALCQFVKEPQPNSRKQEGCSNC